MKPLILQWVCLRCACHTHVLTGVLRGRNRVCHLKWRVPHPLHRISAGLTGLRRWQETWRGQPNRVNARVAREYTAISKGKKTWGRRMLQGHQRTTGTRLTECQMRQALRGTAIHCIRCVCSPPS